MFYNFGEPIGHRKMNEFNIIYSRNALERFKYCIRDYVLYQSKLDGDEELWDEDHLVEFAAIMFLKNYKRSEEFIEGIEEFINNDPEIHVIEGPVDNILKDLKYAELGLIVHDKYRPKCSRIFRIDSPPTPIVHNIHRLSMY